LNQDAGALFEQPWRILPPLTGLPSRFPRNPPSNLDRRTRRTSADQAAPGDNKWSAGPANRHEHPARPPPPMRRWNVPRLYPANAPHYPIERPSKLTIEAKATTTRSRCLDVRLQGAGAGHAASCPRESSADARHAIEQPCGTPPVWLFSLRGSIQGAYGELARLSSIASVVLLHISGTQTTALTTD